MEQDVSGDVAWEKIQPEETVLLVDLVPVPPRHGEAGFQPPEQIVIYAKGEVCGGMYAAGGAAIFCRVGRNGAHLEPPRLWTGKASLRHGASRMEVYALAWALSGADFPLHIPVLVRSGQSHGVKISAEELEKRHSGGWKKADGKPMAAADAWEQVYQRTQGRELESRPLTDVTGDEWAERVGRAAKAEAERAMVEWIGGGES